MTTNIDGSTVALVSTALDAAVMRQQAIAQNIANAATPGYRRLEVSFEERVSSLMEANGQVRAPKTSESATLQPYIRLAADGANVALDSEVARMADNTLHHQVLLKALSRHYALIGMAINGAKR